MAESHHIKNFLIIDGIAGNSKKAGAEDSIEILGWSLSGGREISDHSSNTALTTGTLSMSPLSITKYTDLSTPLIIRSCWKAEPITKIALLMFTNESDQPYGRFDFSDCAIAKHSVDEASKDNRAIETLTIAFKHIEFTYTDENGNVATKHDTTTGITD